MRLVIYCKKCSTRNSLKIKAKDRVELKMKYREKINVTCKKCKTTIGYGVKDIKAEQRFGYLISFIFIFILMFLVGYLLWDYAKHQLSSLYLIPVGLFVSLLIYIAINKEINNKIRNFNKS